MLINEEGLMIEQLESEILLFKVTIILYIISMFLLWLMIVYDDYKWNELYGNKKE